MVGIKKEEIEYADGKPILAADETLQQVFYPTDIFLLRYADEQCTSDNQQQQFQQQLDAQTEEEGEGQKNFGEQKEEQKDVEEEEDDEDEEEEESNGQTEEKYEGFRGTLFVTSRRVFWIDDGTSSGFKWHFSEIVTHAVANEEAQPCLFCQIEVTEKYEEPRNFELRIIPSAAKYTVEEAKLLVRNMFDLFCNISSTVEDVNQQVGESDEESGGGGDGFLGGHMFFNAQQAQKAMRVRQMGQLSSSDDEDSDGNNAQENNGRSGNNVKKQKK